MTIVATDLDRTLFPNGKQPYDNTMPLFASLVREADIGLVYVTGRNLDQIMDGVREYDPPLPRYAVAEVGTRIYERSDGAMHEDESYVEYVRVNTPAWDIAAFRRVLAKVSNLRLQEVHNQNDFKLSFYVDHLDTAGAVVEEVRKRVEQICTHTTLIYSVDETVGQGLLDILPRHANKMEGLEFVRKKMGASQDDVIYCGDSGNDVIPLTFGYRAVLVKNATDEVRAEVRRRAEAKKTLERIYFACGNERLNGNYVSGVLEGLLHFGVLEPSAVRPST